MITTANLEELAAPLAGASALVLGSKHVGAEGLFRERVHVPRHHLRTLDATGARYEVLRGGPSVEGKTLFHWEDSPTWRLSLKRVAESLGMRYVSRAGISGWRASLLRRRPDVAVFDVESEFSAIRGNLAAHEAADMDPALVVGILSARDDIDELAGELPGRSKAFGTEGLAKWLRRLAETTPTMVEVSIGAAEWGLVQRLAEMEQEA